MVFLVKYEIVRIIARQIKSNCLVISRSLLSSDTLLVNKHRLFTLCATRALRRTFSTISQTFHEPEEMPVVCRSSAQPQLPWQHFLEFLKLPGLKQPHSLLQKYLDTFSHGKCGLVASSPPAIPGLSEEWRITSLDLIRTLVGRQPVRSEIYDFEVRRCPIIKEERLFERGKQILWIHTKLLWCVCWSG